MKTRGTDLVIVGLLVWLVWRNYNQYNFLGACDPGNVANSQEPFSTMTGPAWLRGA